MTILRETEHVSPPDHRAAVTMQGMANEINKMKRQLTLASVFGGHRGRNIFHR